MKIETRTKTVGARLTEKEYIDFSKRAYRMGLRKSAYAREVLLQCLYADKLKLNS